MNKLFYKLGVIAVLLIYLLFRLGWQTSIMFGYDMPRVALITQDYLNHGSFLTSQNYFEDSSWQNIPWGPSFIFYYSFFLSITSHPITASLLVGIFNIISVVCLIIIGYRYFTPLVGITAGLLLATHPVWVSYSRIIYQPTPVIPFISISLLLLFLFLEQKQKIFLSLLIFSWAVLIQIYLPTSSFILTSISIVILKFKTLSKKYLILGLLLSLSLFIPTIKYYIQNPLYLHRFFEAPSKFTPPEKSFTERIIKINSAYFENISGAISKWDIGYAYDDFLSTIPFSRPLSLIFFSFALFVILYNIYVLVIDPKKRLFRAVLLSFSLCPYWFLSIVWVTDLVPRYFLLAFPSFCLLISLTLNDFVEKFKPKFKQANIIWIVILLIATYWSIYTYKYNYFIKNYNYPYGRLSGLAETPYLFLEQTIKWVINDANQKGYDNFTINNEYSSELNSQWLETKYILRYVLIDNNYSDNPESKHKYILVHSDILETKKLANYAKFGPFVAFEEK